MFVVFSNVWLEACGFRAATLLNSKPETRDPLSFVTEAELKAQEMCTFNLLVVLRKCKNNPHITYFI